MKPLKKQIKKIFPSDQKIYLFFLHLIYIHISMIKSGTVDTVDEWSLYYYTVKRN